MVDSPRSPTPPTPAPPRRPEWLRWTRISLRSLHLLSFGGLLGGTAMGVDASLLDPWWAATLLTGLGLAWTFVYESLDWFKQLSGLIVMTKLLAVASVPLAGDHGIWVLGALVIVSSFSSHMPGRIRHWVPPVLRGDA